MCMSLALSAPGFGIVAADTRFTGRYDGKVRDLGSKIRLVPDGWVAATGDGHVIMSALRTLEQTGIEDPAKCRKVTIPSVHEYFAGRLTHELPTSCFLAVRQEAGNYSTHVFETDGTGEDGASSANGQFDIRVAWPPRMDPKDQQAAMQRMRRKIAASRRVQGIIRHVAECFAFSFRHGEEMSREVELGLTSSMGARYLRRDALWLANASDAQITEAFTAPPAIPPFPDLPAEQVLFQKAPPSAA